MKHDGTLTVDGEVTPLQRIFLSRRSCRRYAKGEANEEQLSYVLGCVEKLRGRGGLDAARVEVLGPGPKLDALVKAAMKGLIGKINPWLPFMKARHMLLCGAVYPSSRDVAGIEQSIKQASMAMQAALLAATEVGLGSCWLAGINHEQIERVHRMPDDARLVAISPLGVPPGGKGISWDALTYHLTSKRRKPLSELWKRESWAGEGGER